MSLVIKLKREKWCESMIQELRQAFPNIKSNRQLVEVLLCTAYLKFIMHSPLISSDTNNIRDTILLIDPKKFIKCVSGMVRTQQDDG